MGNPYFCFPLHSCNGNAQQYHHCDSPYDSDIIHFVDHQRSIFLTKQKIHNHVLHQVNTFPKQQHFIHYYLLVVNLHTTNLLIVNSL